MYYSIIILSRGVTLYTVKVDCTQLIELGSLLENVYHLLKVITKKTKGMTFESGI